MRGWLLICAVLVACGGPAKKPVAPATTAEMEPAPLDEVSPERARTLSEYLVQRAAAAVADKDYLRAVAIYAGLVAARGDGAPAGLELARARAKLGQFAAASRAYGAFATATDDPAAKAIAVQESTQLGKSDNAVPGAFPPARAPDEAAEALALGRRWRGEEKYGDALVYFRMAAAMDPTDAEPILEIGRTFEQLGYAEQTVEYYRTYLWHRPAGPAAGGAVAAIEALGRGDQLGRVTVTSSLPCDEVWIEGDRVSTQLPIDGMKMAPGKYTWLCYSERYAMAYFASTDVGEGQPVELAFSWAVLRNELANPTGRIVLEDARHPGKMLDLGIEIGDYGVPVSTDGAPLKMILRDAAGNTVEERSVTIAPGATHVVSWSKR